MKTFRVSQRNNNITWQLVSFCIPLILSGVLQQLYAWADAFIVGNVDGEVALAAIGCTGTVSNLLIGLITGFTLGLNIMFGQMYGSGKTEKFSGILKSFAIIFAITFCLFAIAGYIFTPDILRIMDTPQETFSSAVTYLRIILIGIPFLAVYNVYAAGLRGIGDSKLPFYSVLVSSVANVILDIIFVWYMKMGVAGAAIATILSQIAMTAYLIIYGSHRYQIIKHSDQDNENGKHFHFVGIKEGSKLGIPPMLQNSVRSFGGLILQNFMNGFGTATVAAITTAYRVDCVLLIPVINLGTGISTLVAQNIGAGDWDRARKTLKSGNILVAVISVVLTAFIYFFGGKLIAMFGVGPEAAEIGRRFFISLASFYIVFGLATSIRGYIEGIGDVTYSSILGIVCLGVRIGMSYVLVGVFDNMVIAFAEAISWIVMLALYIIRYLNKSRQPEKEAA